MSSLSKFVFGLAAAFGLPWLVLVIIPTLKAQKLTTLSYDKDRDGIEGVYPGSGIYRQDQIVYLREGCAQCHTQMIRPPFVGIMDGWKKGWGSDQSAQPKNVVRPSTMRDYLGEPAHVDWSLIRAAYTSVAGRAVVPLQDVLGLGSRARMNVPGRPAGNWAFRAPANAFAKDLAGRLRRLAELTGRVSLPPKEPAT